ncbi:MAG: hypothetical protein KKF44_02425 [Nanoarchaeota archaeon]|nr:hypothetical protein [Nanoarchaeota archaeon]
MNRNVRTDRDKDILYNVLIIAMIIGFVIALPLSINFRKTLYEPNAPFTELFFDKPDDLPNWIKTDKVYPFSFHVKSNEDEIKKFTYKFGVELYQLYTEIESKYHCLNKYRDTTYIEYTNETENISLFFQPKLFKPIQNLAVLPEFSKTINWTSFYMETAFSPTRGMGILKIYFRDEKDIKYIVTFDEQKKQILFNNKITYRSLDLKRDNNKIKFDTDEHNLKVILNGIIVVDEQFENLTHGQFGFESQDGYFGISGFTVYKETLYPIPDTGEVWQFRLNDNYMHQRIAELKSIKTKTISLDRTSKLYNQTVDCEIEPFYCQYYDLPNDISFFVDTHNITEVIDKIPVTRGNLAYNFFPSAYEKTNNDWSAFEINFSHAQIMEGNPMTNIINFADKWSIMMTRNNSYFIRPINATTIQIDEIKNPQKSNETRVEFISIKVDSEKIRLFLNDIEVFTRDTPYDYTNGFVELDQKNGYMVFSPIELSNNDTECSDPYSLKFCKIFYEPYFRGPTRQIEPEEDYEIQYYSYDPNNNQMNIFEYTTGYKEVDNLSILMNDSFFTGIDISVLNKTPTVKHTLNYPIYNPLIKDRRIIMNSLSTRIANATNFSVEYSYESIEGVRVMEIGLQDFAGNEIVSIYAMENQDKIVVYCYDGKETIIDEMPVFINNSEGHTLKLEFIEGNGYFQLDRKTIYQLNKTKVKDGFFFVGSRNTYVEMNGIVIRKDNGYYNQISLSDDPCELKLISRFEEEKILRLSPDETVSLSGNFEILNSTDFDYGKVFVELYGSSQTNESNPLEIHFWVMRDDT